MKTTVLALALGLMTAPVLAQQSAEDARASAIVLPVIQENTRNMPGASEYIAQLLTACVVAVARPEEKAALASASGPTQALSDEIIMPILSRPDLARCIEASRSPQ